MPRVPRLAVYNIAHAFWESCFADFHLGWPSDCGTTLVGSTLETSGGSAGWWWVGIESGWPFYSPETSRCRDHFM